MFEKFSSLKQRARSALLYHTTKTAKCYITCAMSSRNVTCS